MATTESTVAVYSIRKMINSGVKIGLFCFSLEDEGSEPDFVEFVSEKLAGVYWYVVATHP